jgi:large subunit ribosomal protein L35Ae
MSQPVYGRILNYRIGIRTQCSRECLIKFANVTSVAQAGPLIGHKVVWKSKNKAFIGKIVGLHGKNGTVRAKFKKGVPGKALGTRVDLVS